jgi:hypothetical protein
VSRRCTGQNSVGETCGAWALRDGRYCYLHDPAHADKAAEARKLGGLRRRREGTLNAAFELGDVDTIEGQRRLLEIVVTDALALDNGAPKLRILIVAISTAMKLRETSDLELRLRRLERAQAPRPERPPRGDAVTSLLDEPGP